MNIPTKNEDGNWTYPTTIDDFIDKCLIISGRQYILIDEWQKLWNQICDIKEILNNK